jgi:hypothetical protein
MTLTDAGEGVPEPAPTEEVRTEWGRRIEAEYRSAAFTQHFTLWLIQLGAPPDLIDAGLRTVADELAHAELSHAVYAAAGGTMPPRLDRSTLRLPHVDESELELAVLCHGIRMYCLGETVAVRLFRRLRERCSVPVARTALDRILKDEAFHRDFGWALLDWLLATPARPRFLEVIAARLPQFLKDVRADYVLEGAPAHDLPDTCRAWGLMGAPRYREAFVEAVRKDYRPRFQALGIRFDEAPLVG